MYYITGNVELHGENEQIKSRNQRNLVYIWKVQVENVRTKSFGAEVKS